MIGAVILVLGLAVVVAAVVAVVRRSTHHGPAAATTPEGHVVRQLFQYLLLFVLLVVSAIGVSGLLAALFAQGTTIAVTDAAIARSIAFTVVGLPLLLGLALVTRRTLAEDPAEARSLPWVFYLSVAGPVSLIVALFALHDALAWALGLRLFDPQAPASALVWTTVWAVHWRLGRRQVDQEPMQPSLLAGSLLGLAIGLVGLGTMLSATLETWFDLADGPMLVGTYQPILEGAVTFVLAGACWVLYWLLAALRSERTALWHAYVLLIGVTGGLVVALTAASFALARVLVWVLGDPWTDDASRYFDPMPATLAATAVGLLTLAYHQGVLRTVARTQRSELDRVHDYLLAAVGLGAAAAGAIIVVVALVEAVAEPSVMSGGGAANTLIVALTLLGVGVPVWWLFWGRGQRAAAAGTDEIGSVTRRLYLFLLLGLTSVASVAALIAGAWLLVDRILQDESAAVVLRSIRYPIGILVTAAAVAAYHWAVYRSDRRRPQPAARRGPGFVLLLGVADAATAAAIGRRTGALVWAWTREDVAGRPWPEDDLAAVVEASGAPEVVVIEEAGELRAIPVVRRAPLPAPGPAAPAAPTGVAGVAPQ